MPIPLVWSERVETVGVTGLHDCTQSAALMCLVYAGKTDYEYGIYTPTERNALDAADDRPDNTGATLDGETGRDPHLHGDLDQQVKNRYGVVMHRLPDDSDATLRRFLSTPGYAFLLQGTVGSWPAGSRLRITSYTGAHAICAITGPKPLLGDPLAANRSAFVPVTVDELMQFAWTGSAYSRYLKQDELAPSLPNTATSGGIVGLPVYKAEQWTVPAEADIYELGIGAKRPEHILKGVEAVTLAEAADGSWRLVCIGQRDLNGVKVPDKLAIVARASLDPKVQGGDAAFNAAVGGAIYGNPPAAGYTKDQLNSAVKAAVDPLYKRIDGIKAKAAAFAKDVADD